MENGLKTVAEHETWSLKRSRIYSYEDMMDCLNWNWIQILGKYRVKSWDKIAVGMTVAGSDYRRWMKLGSMSKSREKDLKLILNREVV